MREAGDHTGWLSPDQAYESAVHAAVDASYDDPAVGAVLDGLLDVVLEPGRSNALAAKLVALTMPGVPDVYQGTELWDLSLVDPDNRRPVDFDLRRRVLAGDVVDGAAKLRVVRQALTTAPRPSGALHVLHTGCRPRARPPTTCWRSTAAVPSPW